MFPSPVTTTPFSVKDILNLEQQQQGGLAPMELSSPSCMLATFKQEAFGSEPSALPELPEPPPAKPPAAFPGPYYVKSYGEMDTAKDSKADKKGKTAARGCGTALGPLQPGPGARGERELRRSALRLFEVPRWGEIPRLLPGAGLGLRQRAGEVRGYARPQLWPESDEAANLLLTSTASTPLWGGIQYKGM